MRRYLALHEFWRRVAPPAILSLGRLAEYKPPDEDPTLWLDPALSPENPRLREARTEGEQLIEAMPGGVAVPAEGFMFGPPLLPKSGEAGASQ